MKKKARRSVLGMALLIVAASIGGPAAAQPEPYTINVILSLSGPGANLGRDSETALHAFEKYINRNGGIRGTPVRLHISDDQTSPTVAVQLFQQILQSHPQVVIGATLAGPTQALEPFIGNGPLLYAVTPVLRPARNSYLFSASALNLSRVMVPYFKGRGIAKLASIVTNDASGQANESVAETALASPENGGAVRLVDKEIIGPADISATAQAAKIKASGAQAVLASQNGTQLGVVLHALSDAGLDVPVYTSAGNFSPDLLNQYKSILPKELLATGTSFFNRDRAQNDPLKKPIDDFYAALAGEGVTVPITTQALAWDPALIVVSALRALGTGATADQIRDWIEKLRDFRGVMGTYDFTVGDQHGLNPSSLLVIRSDPERPGHPIVVSRQGGAPL